MAVPEAIPADLPDPLQSLDDDTAANADALLRQLADEEVDRLLTVPKDSASLAVTPAVALTDTAPLPAPDGPAAASEAREDAEDATFSAAVIDRPSEPALLAVSEAHAPAGADEGLEADLRANTTARGDEAPSAVAEVSADLAVAVAEQEQREILGLDRVPLALRPLVWINRPFEGLSASSRELLGTIGLVTMINALVVLLYVMLVRG